MQKGRLKMAAHRQYAGKPIDIFKTDYNEIIKSAKRKHSSCFPLFDEFYIFKTGDWYSECCVDTFNCSIEHWKRTAKGRWYKAN